MARLNIKFLGISELKWTGMGKFNSDDHYIYYCGQKSLRRNDVALIVGFPGDSDNPVSVCNVGDLGSIPGLKRCPGEGNGSPLQYSCWKRPWTAEPGESMESQRVGHN